LFVVHLKTNDVFDRMKYVCTAKIGLIFFPIQ
jgi:hypothetical protein